MLASCYIYEWSAMVMNKLGCMRAKSRLVLVAQMPKCNVRDDQTGCEKTPNEHNQKA